MISKGDYIVIHELYEKGYSLREISRILKIDRKTVTRRLKQTEYVVIRRSKYKESKLEPFKKFIIEYINKINKRIPSSVILNEIKNMGYTGGRSILQNFLKNEYDKKFIHKDPIVRFETDPGEQAQVDWTTIRSGRNPIYAFVMTLGYSRKTFVYFTENMGADNLILCHEKAFLFFGGVTKHILYDNMKDVVIERNKYGRGLHKFNIKLESFAKKYGFKIKLCKPYRAKTKGKVERFNSYLKSNFYRPLLIKLQDANLKVTTEVLNNYVSNWLENANNRIHGTINKKPNDVFIEELPYLITFVLDKSQIEVKRKTQQLPKITVQQSDFIEYDNLLGVVI